MSDIVTLAQSVYRDYNTDGVPVSGEHDPVKAEIISIFVQINALLSNAGIGGQVSKFYATKSAMNADLTPAANTVALVYADSTAANNDYYVKVGGTGTGSWAALNILPSSAILASLTSSVAANAAAIADEITDRENAISNEEDARVAADTALSDALTALSSQAFKQRGTLANSTDISTIVVPGTYWLSANGSYVNVPAGLTTTIPHFLHVRAYGGSGGVGAGRWIEQELYTQGLVNGVKTRFRRTFDTQNPDNPSENYYWYQEPMRADIENFQQRGTLPSGSVASVIVPGVYLLDSGNTYTGVPSDYDASRGYWLEVSNYGGNNGVGNGRFVLQKLWLHTPTVGKRTWWTRRCDSNTPTDTTNTNAWINMITTAQPYASRGQIPTNTDLGTLWLPGCYLGQAGFTYTGMPADFDNSSTSFFFIVDNYGGNADGVGNGRFVHQVLISMGVTGAGESGAYRPTWERNLDSQNPDSTALTRAWLSVSGAGGGSGGGGSALGGKRLVWLGDSRPQGSGAYKYPPLIAASTGMTIVNACMGGTCMALHNDTNFDGVGGYRLSEAIKQDQAGDTDAWDDVDAAVAALITEEDEDFSSQVAALKAQDWDEVDYVIIDYGSNDFAKGRDIGTASDSGSSSIKGAINKMVTDLVTAYPHLRLFFLTPGFRNRLYSTDDNSDVTPNTNSVYMRDFCAAMMEQVSLRHMRGFDLYAGGIVGPENQALYLSDGLHPRTTEGTELYRSLIEAALLAQFR